MSWAFYELSRHPAVLSRLRQELKDVFGAGDIGDQIQADTGLLNKTPYLSAVLRKTLRLYPPAASVRRTEQDYFLSHNGKEYNAKGCMLCV